MQRVQVSVKPKKRVLLVGLFLLVLSLFPQWESVSQQQIQQTMEQAVVTFTIARGLNGVISVIQETEVSIQPAGVGVSFEPGQILDPLNDLVESFSDVMLTSSVVLVSLRLLTELLSQTVFKAIILIVGLLWLLNYAFRLKNNQAHVWLSVVMVSLISLRLFIPIAFIVSHQFADVLLDDYYQTSTQVLTDTTEEFKDSPLLQEAQQSQAAAQQSWADKIAEAYNQAKSVLDIQQQVDNLVHQADLAIEHSIQLMVVFIIKVILLPLLIGIGFLWMVKRVIRHETIQAAN